MPLTDEPILATRPLESELLRSPVIESRRHAELVACRATLAG